MQKLLSCLKNPRFIINFSGFLDLFGVSLIMPLILPQARSLGASSTVVGIFGFFTWSVERWKIIKERLSSSYGALQLFSSPVVGKWSDIIGRRVSLLVSLVVTGCGYGMLGFSSSIFFMFLTRIPGGIFKHSQNISKSYLADITSRDRRSHVYGQFSSASSIGFILGPMFGGIIAQRPGGFAIVGMLSAAIFLLNAALIWFLLPPTLQSPHPEISREDSVTSLKTLSSGEYSFSVKEMFRSFKAIKWDNLWDLYLLKFLLGFSIILFRANFSLMTQMQFDASPRTRGLLTSYSGLVSTLSGFLVGRIARFYNNDGKLFLHMTILQIITLAGLTISPSLMWLSIWLCPLSIVTSVNRVIATTLTIHRGGDQDRGALMGFTQSVMSVARMLAPFVGGLVMEISSSGPVCIATVVSIIALLILLVRPQDGDEAKVKQS